MNKYRVLKSYPKQITNSGRLVNLKPGAKVYLKKEAQVLRLVRMGFLKPVVEMPKRRKPQSKRKPSESRKEAQPASSSQEDSSESKPELKEAEAEDKSEHQESKRKSKSEYLNKKKKGKSKDSQSN